MYAAKTLTSAAVSVVKAAREMKESVRGSLALVAVAVMIAAMGVLVRSLGKLKLDVMHQIPWRVAAAALFGAFLWRRRPTFRALRHLPAQEWRILAVRALLVYAIHLPLLSLSFLYGKYLDVAAAYCFPFPTIFGILLYKEKLDVRRGCWLGISLLALLIISLQLLPTWNMGHLYALLAGAAAGLAMVMRRSHQDGLSSEAATYAMLLLGTVFVILPAAAAGQMTDLSHLSWRAATFVMVAGILNVACVLLGNYALAGRVDGMRAGSLMTLQIPVAYLLSAAVGERLSLAEITGAVLLLVSVWGVNYREETQPTVLALEGAGRKEA